MPFATEEAWSWSHDGSVHVAAWPNENELPGVEDGTTAVLDLASRALTAIRRAKTDAKVSQRTGVNSAVITGTDQQIALLAQAAADLRAVGRIADLGFAEGDELTVTDVVLEAAPES